MRLFVKYNNAGEILSVSRVETMPSHVEHPYSDVQADEAVLELPKKDEYAQLDPLQFLKRYEVDVKKKKLAKKA